MKGTEFRLRRAGWAAFPAAALILLSAPMHAETIDDALASAYLANPQLEAARATQRAADESVPQALSAWKPTVAITGSYAYLNTHLIDPTSQTIDSKPIAGTIQLQQNLYTFGRNEGDIERAEAGVLAGRAQLVATESSVLLGTATAYMDVVLATATVELNRNNVVVLERQLAATNDRFRVGEITRTDVAQAEAALSAAHSQLTAAEAQLANARAAYERLVGRPAENVALPPHVPPLPPTPEEAQATAMARNPQLIAARYAEQASRAGIEFARAALLPQLVAQGSFSYNETSAELVYGQPGTLRETAGQVGLQLQIPLNVSGLAYSQLRQAKQTNSQDVLNIANTERTVRESVVDAWEALRSARATIQSSQEQVRANGVALEGVRQEAQVGSRTTLDVLNAEQLLLQSQVSLATAQHNEVVAAYQLLSAVGKLTAADLGLSVALYDPEAYYNDVRNRWFGADVP